MQPIGAGCRLTHDARRPPISDPRNGHGATSRARPRSRSPLTHPDKRCPPCRSSGASYSVSLKPLRSVTCNLARRCRRTISICAASGPAATSVSTSTASNRFSTSCCYRPVCGRFAGCNGIGQKRHRLVTSRPASTDQLLALYVLQHLSHQGTGICDTRKLPPASVGIADVRRSFGALGLPNLRR